MKDEKRLTPMDLLRLFMLLMCASTPTVPEESPLPITPSRPAKKTLTKD